MAASKSLTEPSYLECPICKNVQTIHRLKSRLKKKNHIKHMWCPKCRKVTGHMEVKEDIFFPRWLKDVE